MRRAPPHSGSGVPPLKAGKDQSRDGSATSASPRCQPAAPVCHPEPAETAAGRLSSDGKSLSLPAGWVRTTLGEILPIKYGKARSPQFGYVREETATYGSNGVFGTFDRALTTKPAIIVGRKGAAGAVHYSPEPCWPIDTAFYTEENENIFLPFFRYLLESLQLVALDRSTAIPSLSRDDYDAKTICYPESVAEQRRIVAEIEKQFTRLEAGVAALRRVQANLHRYRAAVLKAAFEGNWAKRKVGETASLVTKGSSPNWQGFDYCDDGIIFVRSQNVGWGLLDLSDVAHLPVAFNAKEKKSVLKAGDVLLNIVGASIGRAAVATGEIEGGNVNQAVAVIRLKEEAMLPRFLMFYLVSPTTQVLIHSEKVDVARANFSLEDIRRLPVPVPPLAEQERIVAEVERRLSVVEELSVLVTANLQRATRLRQSILKKAFSGELLSHNERK